MSQVPPPRQILLIDADAGDRTLTQQALTQAFSQIQIQEIVHADALIETLTLPNLDLVITESELPGMGGLDLLRKIKTQHPHCPVIMYTACTDLEWAIATMKAGLDDYVVKSTPASLPHLVSAIREAWADATTKIEANLQASEARFQEIANTISQLFFIRSATTRQFLYVNPAYETIWGHSCESLYQNPDSWLESVHPDDLPIVLNSVSQQFKDRPVTREYRILRPDGEIRWIFAQINLVHDEDGNLVRFIGFATDITQRKHLEQALQASEAKLNDILDSAMIAIARTRAYADCTWTYEFCSKGHEQVFGYTAAELMADTTLWASQVLPEDLAAIRVPTFEAIFAGRDAAYEYRFCHKDGTLRWIASTLTAYRDDRQDCWIATVVSTDITQRKRTEAALRESQEQLQLALEASGEGLWDWNIETNEVYRSPRYLEILGYAVGELPDFFNAWEHSIHPDDYPHLLAQLNAHLQDSAVPYFCDYRMRTQSGDWQWISDYGKVVLRDAQNKPLRMIGTFKDISDRKAAEAALQRSQQQYQTLVENSPDLIERFDTQMRHLYVSPLLTQMTGIPTNAFFGKTCRELGLSEAMINTWEAAMQLLLQTGEKQTIEFEILTLEGVRSFEMAIAPELTPDQTIESILCISRDVTERKASEMALQKLNQELEQRVQERTTQLYLVLSAVQMGTWEWDMSTNVETWSSGIYQIMGFQTDQLGRVLDKNGVELSPYPTHELFIQHLYPSDRDIPMQALQQSLQQRSPYECEFRMIHPDGSIRWCYSRGAYVFDQQGQPLRLIGIAMDISDRKQAEEVLRQQARQERLLRSITQEIRQSLNLSAILKTAVTEVRKTLQTDRVAVYRFNPDWSGSFIAESVGRGWKKLVGSNIRKVWEDTYLQETQGGRYRNHETFAVTDVYTIGHQACHIALLEQFQARAYAIAPIFSGDMLWGLLAIYQNAAPRQWQSWEVELLQQIANQLAIALQQSALYEQLQTELQERRQIEDQLRTSLKEKEVLLREVHHRVKNNMQLVSSLLRLQSDSIADPTVLKLFSESQSRVKTMALIHERLYRSDNLAQINFPTYIQSLVSDLVGSYTSGKTSISVQLQVADLELDLDTAVPCALLINELVSNALKYAFPNRQGEITLQFEQRTQGTYCLIVKDNGIGLPQHINPQQTDSLGMQLIYGLTEQLGGAIAINTQSGTEFKIIFKGRV
jgi:PAS domain S-box-containing protein